jgi:hypothetical protein
VSTDRSQAADRWRRVADGALDRGPDPWDQADVELRDWIRGVAAALLVTEQIGSPTDRRAAVHEAVGLAGKHDGYAALRAFVQDVRWDFDATGADGIVTETRAAEIVKEARQRGLLTGVYEVDDKKARDLIRSLRTKQV